MGLVMVQRAQERTQETEEQEKEGLLSQIKM